MRLNQTLQEQRIDNLVVIGETTSGCVQTKVVDAFSLGYPVTIMENCIFDHNPISHVVNLYDMHHKHATTHLDLKFSIYSIRRLHHFISTIVT